MEKILKYSLIILGIGFLIYIFWEGRQYKEEEILFCKEQCNYIPEQKQWEIDLGWFFKEEGVTPEKETYKTFGEKDLDTCINYCKYLNDHLTDLLFPEDQRYDPQ